MQSGIMFGAVEAMEGIVRRIKSELGADPRVVATGGFAKLFSAHTSMIDCIEPSLVLDGVRIIYEINKKRER